MKSEPSKLDQTINLEDDITIDEDLPSTSKAGTSAQSETEKKKDSGPPEMIDLTIDESDAESEDIPLRPRRKTGNPKYIIEDSSSSSSGSSMLFIHQ